VVVGQSAVVELIADIPLEEDGNTGILPVS
jgi:hypothetical protein